MNRIRVQIPEGLLPEVRAGLLDLGVGGMTISNLKQRSWEGSTDWLALEVLANPYEVESMIDVLLDILNKHSDLDGELWVLPLEGVIRIRTGEIDSDAIE